jgi:nicotinate phosphoribosyltransferase
MPPRRKKRIDPALFELPVERIRAGLYSDVYFTRAQAALRNDGRVARVTWQVSAKRGGWVGGIDEAVALLRLASESWEALEVHALYEGDRVEPWDTVLLVEGDYAGFAHLETLVLGTLGRRTRVCTNVRHLVDAARPK